MVKPSGSIRWSVVPVARQSRPIEPVFCGISGATRTTCIGAGPRSGERHAAASDREDDLTLWPGLGVPHELVVRRAEETDLVGAALGAAVENVRGADPQRRGVEGLA